MGGSFLSKSSFEWKNEPVMIRGTPGVRIHVWEIQRKNQSM
jgi:hypothetical protein